MNIIRAKMIIDDLVGYYIPNWKVKYDFCLNRFGICRYMGREIGISLAIVNLSHEDDVIETVLHEIAHAMTRGEKHGIVWKAVYVEIGGNGEILGCLPDGIESLKRKKKLGRIAARYASIRRRNPME